MPKVLAAVSSPLIIFIIFILIFIECLTLCQCYGLNMGGHQYLYVETLIPAAAVFGCGVSREVLNVK